MKNHSTLLIIQDKIVSGELVDEQFVCNLSRCKGACCVAGDLGAPVDKAERQILDDIYPEVEPYMREEGKREIMEQGKYVYDMTGNYSTPLINGGACAYVYFDEKGVALCAIEKAYFEGKIAFQKPISCHLYPIRIKKSKQMEALNYDKWNVCSPACELGKTQKMPVYQFVKTALIRKYGESFYEELDGVVKDLIKNEEIKK